MTRMPTPGTVTEYFEIDSSAVGGRFGVLARSEGRPTRHLHMTVNNYEMLGPSRFYRHLTIEFLRFLDVVTERPLPGMRVTTELITGESHASGLVDAYRSFLRTCYPGVNP